MPRLSSKLAAGYIESGRGRIAFRVNGNQPWMADPLMLICFIVIIMIAVTIAIFAKLICIMVTSPRYDPVAHVIGREEGLATVEAVLNFEHHRLAMRTLIPMVEKHGRSEEHTSELQSLMRISYAVFCLKKKVVTL